MGRKISKSKSDDIEKVIRRVSKKDFPNLIVTRSGQSMIAAFVLDILNRVLDESKKLAIQNKRSKKIIANINVHDLRTAFRLMLPGELGTIVIQEGNRALSSIKN